MKILRDPFELRQIAMDLKHRGQSLGFVPTMGDLHDGHASLIARAKSENRHTCVSLFVNPIQFNDPKDYEKYPKEKKEDLERCKNLEVDFVFVPQVDDLYPSSAESLDTFRIVEEDLSRELCGKSRPGHFSGMLTIVMKLFQIAQPTRAYFGEKDFQQLHLVRAMAKAFFLSIEVVPCPIVREKSGLAMSSRNARLTFEQRAHAAQIFKIVKSADSAENCERLLSQAGFEVDYLREKWGRRLVAVNFCGVRLIDNLSLDELDSKDFSPNLLTQVKENSL